jgi:hypothetical protein
MDGKTKTIVIWDTQIDPIQFFILDGDYGHLNECYINSVENENGQRELNKLLDYNDEGVPKVSMLDRFPLEEITEANGPVRVIVAGFLP